MKDYEVEYWAKKSAGEVSFSVFVSIILLISGVYLLISTVTIYQTVVGIGLIVYSILETTGTVYFKLKAMDEFMKDMEIKETKIKYMD